MFGALEFLVVTVSPEELRYLDTSMENIDGSVHPKLRLYRLGGMEKQRDSGDLMGHEISAGHGEDRTVR